MAFRVTNIIDGNTIQVAGWKWGDDYSGNKVKVLGYVINPNDAEYANLAKNRLNALLLNKDIELKNPSKVEKGSAPGDDILYCYVYLNDIDISKYFPELKHS